MLLKRVRRVNDRANQPAGAGDCWSRRQRAGEGVVPGGRQVSTSGISVAANSVCTRGEPQSPRDAPSIGALDKAAESRTRISEEIGCFFDTKGTPTLPDHGLVT